MIEEGSIICSLAGHGRVHQYWMQALAHARVIHLVASTHQCEIPCVPPSLETPMARVPICAPLGGCATGLCEQLSPPAAQGSAGGSRRHATRDMSASTNASMSQGVLVQAIKGRTDHSSRPQQQATAAPAAPAATSMLAAPTAINTTPGVQQQSSGGGLLLAHTPSVQVHTWYSVREHAVDASWDSCRVGATAEARQVAAGDEHAVTPASTPAAAALPETAWADVCGCQGCSCTN
jgi:hypothetical protein